jgi:hypothetical protein
MIASVASGEFMVPELMLRQPREGLWRGRIKVPTSEVSEGESVMLSDDSANFWVGVVRSVVVTGPSCVVDLVGGAGLLDSLTEARYYPGGVSLTSLLSELCADAGELAESVAGTVPQWRSRGGSLRAEVSRLARYTTGAWRVVPAGLVSLSVASGDADPPGRFVGEASGSRAYETSTIAPVAGLDVDGWTVGVALWTRGPSSPLRVTLWRAEPSRSPDPPAVVGARVVATSGGRVDVVTDSGVELSSLPLWSVVGVVPAPASGARVLVVDLADDPRATIALSGVFDSVADGLELCGGASETVLSGLQDAGRVVRYGDTIIVPSGPSATPTPQTVMSALAPGLPAVVSKVKA